MMQRVGMALLVAAFMLGTGVLASQGRRMWNAQAGGAAAPTCVDVDAGVCLSAGGSGLAVSVRMPRASLPAVIADAH
jgi:hypothetical protein